jgi:chemotaxis protein methyltransferase CheR
MTLAPSVTAAAAAPATGQALSDRAFKRVAALFERVSGIRLTAAKHALVVSRLQRLAMEAGETNLDRFVERLDGGDLAATFHQRVIDRLTTNETFFFREADHFDHFSQWMARTPRKQWRVWSGASSTGEEIYSLAMVMAERLGVTPTSDWTILGTDLSTSVVAHARQGLYSMQRTDGIPLALLKRWCLKGSGAYEGKLLIDRKLRERVRFETLNLMEPLPDGHGPFDAIWLRNVLIYFDPETKAQIVRRILGSLAPHGVLYTGHAESLSNLSLPVRSIATAAYVHA